MSPEQLRSPKNVDARADLWSLGVVMYELMTGEAPFAGNTVGELCFSIIETTPKSIQTFRDDVPAGLDRVIQRCLQREPARRFANAEELVLALLPFSQGQVSVPRPRARKPPWRAMIVASIVVATVAALVVWRAQQSAANGGSVTPSPSLSLTTEPTEPPATEPSTNEPASSPAIPTTTAAPKPTRPPPVTSKPPQKRPKPSPNATSPAADPNLDIRH
jgi:serine/threonine-protein kinase